MRRLTTVYDANGNVVGNFNGTVTVTDSLGRIVGANNALVGSLPVSLTNGTGTFQVEADSIVGNTHTLSTSALSPAPNGVNISYGTLSISEVAPTATQIALAIANGSPAELSANQSNSTVVNVSLEDSAGNTFNGAGQYVTVSVTGPGTLASGGTSETLYVQPNQPTQVTVESETGVTGTIVVSATGSGLTSATLQIPTYVTTSPASVSVTSTTGKDSNGNPYTLYTVQVLDTNGHVMSTENGTLSVTDNASAVGGALNYGTVTNGVFTVGSAPTTFTHGTATFAVETKTVGTGPVTITIKDVTDNLSTTTTYTFAVGAAAKVAVTPASGAVYDAEAGQSVTISAQLQDNNNNNVAEAGQEVVFSFVSNNVGATLPNGLSAVGSNSANYIAYTNASGVASIQVAIPSTATSGSFEVQASYNGATADSATVYVVGAGSYVTSLKVSGAPTTPVTAGTSLTGITVTGYNAINVAASGGAPTGDTLQVTSSNPKVVAVMANVSTAPASGEVTLSTNGTTLNSLGLMAEAAGTATITVQDISNPSEPSTSFTVTVVAGQGTGALIEYNGSQAGTSSNPLNVTANTPVAVQVVNVDKGGNPVPVTGSTPLWVTLSDNNGGSYRLTPTGGTIYDVAIPAGQASVTVYYVNPSTETISNSGLTASYTAFSLAAATSPSPATNVTAGSPVTVTFTVTDGSGHPVVGVPVSIAPTSGGSLNSADLSASTVTTNSLGQAVVTYTDTKAGDSGTLTGSVQNNTMTAVTQQTGTITIVPAPVATVTTSSGSTVAVDPAGASTVGFSTTPGYWLNSELAYGAVKAHAISFKAYDQYGNQVTTPLSVSAATGFAVASSEGGSFASSIASLSPTSGVYTVYVEDASGTATGQASGTTSNGSITGAPFSVSQTGGGPVNVTLPGAVTTLANFKAGTLVSAATASHASGIVVTIPASALTVPSSGDNYYYFNVAEAYPGTTNNIWIQVTVPSGAAPSGNLTFTIPTTGTTIAVGGTASTVTAAIASFSSSTSGFAPTEGNIYDVFEYDPATAPTSALTAAPTTNITNDGYVRTGP